MRAESDVAETQAPNAPEAQAIPVPRAATPISLTHLAAGLFAVACLAGLLVVLEPHAAGLAGLVLLIGITISGGLLLLLLATGQVTPGAIPPRFFQQIVEADSRPVCMTAPDGAAVYANKAWRRLFGASPSGGIMLPVVAFSSDLDSAQRLYRLVRASSQGEALSEELRLKGPTQRHARVSTSPVGRSGHSVWRVQDLPVRRAFATVDGPRQNVVVQFRPLEKAHKDETHGAAVPATTSAVPEVSSVGGETLEQRFRGLLGNAPVGIGVLDGDGHVMHANQALTALLGLPFADIHAKPFFEHLESRSAAEVRALLALLASGRPMGEPVDLRFQDNAQRTARLYAGRIPGSTESAGILVYIIDTSDRTQLENQFAHSHRMQAVGQLAGGIAHDFNNLLTVINGVAELLMQRHQPGDPSFNDIHQIRSTGLRAAGLVRQLLAFSRQQRLDVQVISPTDIVSDWSITLRRLIGERVTLKVEHGRDLWPVKADPNQLGNVLVNLSVNARDAMPTGGVLTIRTGTISISHTEAQAQGHVLMPPGDYVTIDVADTGIGIPKENLGRIFEPFFTTKEVGHGTGLGLSSVYGIIKQSNGFLFVDSEVGKGTTFRIYLPRCIQTESPAEAVAARPPAVNDQPAKPLDLTGHQTILLVEDEESLQQMTARYLHGMGYTVYCAGNGRDALQLIATTPGKIHLLVTDVVMPGMSGPQLAEKVRELHPSIKVILTSGYTGTLVEPDRLLGSNTSFIEKPFRLVSVANKVCAMFHNHAAPDAASSRKISEVA